MAAHPELADEPLGIVYPIGNTVFKIIKSITYSDNSISTPKEPIVKFVRSQFLPSLIREMNEMNKNGDDFSPVSYLREHNPLSLTSSDYNNMWSYYYPVLDGKANDVTFYNTLAYPSLINNVSLVNAFKLSTDLWYCTTGVTNYGEWQDKTDDVNDKNSLDTIFNTLFPIFAFYKPSYSTNPYIIRQRPSEKYKYMFSAEELSKINEADIDYYKKSAVLIYKKDLMDFKNFFKKILVYGKEIYTYANSLMNPQS